MRTKTKLYLALQAAVCIALAVLLAAAAIDIYLEGSSRKAENPMESIFTPEAVAGKLASIFPLLFAEAGLLAAGLLLGIKSENDKPPKKGLKPRPESPSAANTANPAEASRPAAAAKKTAAIQTLILIAAIVLIIAGVLNGSALDVLYKAITICSECVGLG